MNKKEINNIISLSKNFNYIYFDCFDTLIKRRYSINYCFYRLAELMILEYHLPFSYSDVYNSLIKFFERCDVSFSTNALNVYLHYERYIDVDFDSFIKSFEHEFIQSEIDNIELNGDIKYLLENLKNKNLFVISDYYLGNTVLEKYFVHLLGYNPFNKIIVSADYLAKKSNGSLYKYVEFINDSIMIGDNEISDIERSKKAGMKSFKINSRSNYSIYKLFDLSYEEKSVKDLFKMRNKKHFVANYSYDLFLFCKNYILN